MALLDKVEVWASHMTSIIFSLMENSTIFLFSFFWTPPPTTHPRDYQSGDTKRGEGGLIKMKNKLTLKFILGDLKPF